jgi:hypothetical protein
MTTPTTVPNRIAVQQGRRIMLSNSQLRPRPATYPSFYGSFRGMCRATAYAGVESVHTLSFPLMGVPNLSVFPLSHMRFPRNRMMH